MEQPPLPPPTLNYGGPLQGRPKLSWGQFFLGIFIGLGFSLVYYIMLGSGNMFDRMPFAAFGAITTKLVVGIVLAVRPPGTWKGLGIGLITSIPVAIMIFFGLCFALLAGFKPN